MAEDLPHQDADHRHQEGGLHLEEGHHHHVVGVGPGHLQGEAEDHLPDADQEAQQGDAGTLHPPVLIVPDKLSIFNSAPKALFVKS